MARTKPVLNAVDFENHLKQTIKPGDPVIIVTTGYNHSVSIKPGTYLGKKNDGVSCRVTESHTKYRFRETGEDVGHYWTHHAQERGVMPEYPKANYPERPANMSWSSPEYKEYQEKVRIASAEQQKRYAEYSAKVQEIGKEYEAFKVPYFRHTTLQRNRIYKTDTSIFDLNV